MEALICNVCGDTIMLDRAEVIAAAEIVLFVDAHCIHNRVSVEFCDPRMLSVPADTARATGAENHPG